MPRFSVIVPTFNRVQLLGRALASLVAQTFGDFEALIIDDGSRDETFAAIRPLILSDARFRYHFAQNRGLAGARNLGIGMATGEYITFLDSDDEYLPTHLELRAAYVLAHPDIALLHGGVEVIGDKFVADKNDPTKQIAIADCVIGGTFVIRRDLFSRIGNFGSVEYGDDTAFFERAMDVGAPIARTDAPTYRYYRTESDSLCAIAARGGVEAIRKFRGQSE